MYISDKRLAWQGNWHTRHYKGERICWHEDMGETLSFLDLDRCGKILSFHSCLSKADRKGRRDVTRIEIDEKVFYLKRYFRPRSKSLFSAIFMPFFYTSPAQSECEHYHILNALGIATAVPVAWGEKKTGWISWSCFIITRELEGTLLSQTLKTSRDFSSRRNLIYSLASLIRRIHVARYHYPYCKAKHIYLKDNTIAILDLERLDKFPRSIPKLKKIAKEMATFNKSIAPECLTKTEQLRFVKSYLQCAKIDFQARELIAAIQKRIYDISLGRKWYARLWRNMLLPLKVF